SSVTIAPDTL
ncbi:putative outer membrane pmp10 domain protein, partial [Chlamydia psittaci 02DC15]